MFNRVIVSLLPSQDSEVLITLRELLAFLPYTSSAITTRERLRAVVRIAAHR
jgi:hypothetical protein